MSARLLSSADPRVALAIALCALVITLEASRPASALVVAAAPALELAARGRLRARVLLPTVLLGLPAAALAAWLGAEVGGAFAPPEPGAWPAALGRGALLLARVLAASLVLAWLTARLRLAELTGALASLRVPTSLLDLLALADGQRHVLGRAFETTRAAQAMRLGDVGPRRALAAAGHLAGAVACRAIDRSAVMAEAIQLRGGVASHRLPALRFGRADAAVALVAVAVLGLAAALSWGPAW